jgi:hypothetical protein
VHGRIDPFEFKQEADSISVRQLGLAEGRHFISPILEFRAHSPSFAQFFQAFIHPPRRHLMQFIGNFLTFLRDRIGLPLDQHLSHCGTPKKVRLCFAGASFRDNPASKKILPIGFRDVRGV